MLKTTIYFIGVSRVPNPFNVETLLVKRRLVSPHRSSTVLKEFNREREQFLSMQRILGVRQKDNIR